MPTAPAVHGRKAPGTKHGQTTNRQATREHHTGSKAWRQIRSRVLLRDQYTCQDCAGYGIEVDHKDGDSSNNPADGSNWQTLCKRCHSRKTISESLNN